MSIAPVLIAETAIVAVICVRQGHAETRAVGLWLLGFQLYVSLSFEATGHVVGAAFLDAGLTCFLATSFAFGSGHRRFALFTVSALNTTLFTILGLAPLGTAWFGMLAWPIIIAGQARLGLVAWDALNPTAGARVIGAMKHWWPLPDNMGECPDLGAKGRNFGEGLRYARVDARPRMGLSAEAEARGRRGA